MSDLLDYYARRAPEYDRVYDQPERRKDLASLASLIGGWLAGRDVLEIACGTGYWTAIVAPHARSILATDAVSEVLALAHERCRPWPHVRFEQLDAFRIAEALRQPAEADRSARPAAFDGGLAAFLLSHVERQRLVELLRGFHAPLARGARVVLCDSRYLAGQSATPVRTDEAGNEYQRRTLADGSRHEVLKNYLAPGEVRRILADSGIARVEIDELTYFWCARYTL